MSKLTEHFDSDEFACPCGSPQCVKTDMSLPFMEKLEKFRRLYGKPVTLVHGGGYRCKAYNARPEVGGAPDSMHLYGRAADILAPDDAARRRSPRQH